MQWFSKVGQRQNPLEGLLKQTAGLGPLHIKQISRACRCGWCHRAPRATSLTSPAKRWVFISPSVLPSPSVHPSRRGKAVLPAAAGRSKQWPGMALTLSPWATAPFPRHIYLALPQCSVPPREEPLHRLRSLSGRVLSMGRPCRTAAARSAVRICFAATGLTTH